MTFKNSHAFFFYFFLYYYDRLSGYNEKDKVCLIYSIYFICLIKLFFYFFYSNCLTLDNIK